MKQRPWLSLIVAGVVGLTHFCYRLRYLEPLFGENLASIAFLSIILGCITRGIVLGFERRSNAHMVMFLLTILLLLVMASITLFPNPLTIRVYNGTSAPAGVIIHRGDIPFSGFSNLIAPDETFSHNTAPYISRENIPLVFKSSGFVITCAVAELRTQVVVIQSNQLARISVARQE